jgi:hypothetical protein
MEGRKEKCEQASKEALQRVEAERVDHLRREAERMQLKAEQVKRGCG